MKRLDELAEKNHIDIKSVKDPAFLSYGRVIEGHGFADLVRYMHESTAVPEEGNVYVASVPEMEALPSASVIKKVVFGDMPIQIGYCNGRNTTLNGFEYHKASELNIAVTDLMLFLGHSWDIGPDLKYPAEKAEVFFVEEGTAIEMFGTTLHLSPACACDGGFKDVVVLPRGVNTPLSDAEKAARDAAFAAGDHEARLLLQRGKWVIAHPERDPLIKQGACPGVTGKNTELAY